MFELSAISDLLAAYPNAALVTTLAGELRAANASARELLAIENVSEVSFTAEQLLAALRTINPQFETLLLRACGDANSALLPINERILNTHSGQWMTVQLTACGPTMRLLTITDTTEHDRRLVAVGQLAAGVIHDVNNVLNPILAAAYLLKHHAESPDMVRDYADRIQQAAEAGASTAARIGRFIRQEPLHEATAEHFDLSQIAEELLELVEPTLAQRGHSGAPVHIVRRLAPTAPMRGTRADIRESFLNIYANALDALSEKGGRITVRTARVDNDVTITVADTGDGMPEDVRERAFEPFFTTKGARGSGLGLAEVYGIVSRHRGTALLESTVGRGTTVTLQFPADDTPTVVAAKKMAQAAANPLRILIVEDQTDARELLTRLLTVHGHSVVAVATVAAAREKLALNANLQYHLMLTDVGLPDGSGWELVSDAKARIPNMRIGIITGWEPTLHATEGGSVDFVVRKPLHAAELLSHIAGVSTLAHPE